MLITIATHNKLKQEDVVISETNYKETESYYYFENKGIYSIIPKKVKNWVGDEGAIYFLGKYRIVDIDFDKFSEEIGIKIIPCCVERWSHFGVDVNKFFYKYKEKRRS